MRYATVRTDDGTCAVRVDGDHLVVLDAPDVVTAPSARETGAVLTVDGAHYAPPVVRPSKVICVGLNYRSHLVALGLEIPRYPTLFAKFAATLLGAHDDLVLPAVTRSAVWEVELTVVIGTHLARGPLAPGQALDAVAGYTVANDVTMRDFQQHGRQWLPGKAFDRSTPIGPVLVTPDEVGHALDLEVCCDVDGEVRQSGRTSDLLFPPSELIEYITQFAALEPGDLILTGTPAGSGPDATSFLGPGQRLRSSIAGLGECVNTVVAGP